MDDQSIQLIFGRHPVIDAIRSGTPFDKVLLQEGTRGPFEKELRQLTREFLIPLQVVPRERLNRLVKGNHQGVVGMVSLIPYYRLEDVLPGIFEQSEVPLLLLLDGITDVRNLGAIARSAECLGAHALVIPRKGSAQINAEAIKASAGAITRLPVCRESSLVAAIDWLKQSGIRILVSDLDAKEALHQADLTVPLALVIGSEGEGVNAAIRQLADQVFVIPQKGTTESLNVSVAAGIMLYEVMRQRGG